MAKNFRVVDLRPQGKEVTVEGASSPEDAARKALGIDVVRSGAKKDLVAKVYWQPMEQPLTMVRMYAKVDGTGTEAHSETVVL